MGRAYSTADYEGAAALAREAISSLALTSDIMVGFPGESEEEFSESYCFCERMGFAGMHVFPYSARPDTKAARMENRVADGEKKRRCQLMLELARRSSQRFRELFVGQSMNVLCEGNKDGIWFGLTDNYMRVFLPSHELLSNRVLVTKIAVQHDGILWGELIP
jgi:threonylcarbamoyladenosine tRNA methylthiotransferase MtaB